MNKSLTPNTVRRRNVGFYQPDPPTSGDLSAMRRSDPRWQSRFGYSSGAGCFMAIPVSSWSCPQHAPPTFGRWRYVRSR